MVPLKKISVLSRTNFLAYNAYLIRLSKSVSGGIYNLSQTLNTFNELTRERASFNENAHTVICSVSEALFSVDIILKD